MVLTNGSSSSCCLSMNRTQSVSCYDVLTIRVYHFHIPYIVSLSWLTVINLTRTYSLTPHKVWWVNVFLRSISFKLVLRSFPLCFFSFIYVSTRRWMSVEWSTFSSANSNLRSSSPSLSLIHPWCPSFPLPSPSPLPSTRPSGRTAVP